MSIAIKTCAAAIALAAFLVGCDEAAPQPHPKPDQELRRQIFLQCLNALPAGPVETKYNDWSEVVSECEKAAYFQSLRI